MQTGRVFQFQVRSDNGKNTRQWARFGSGKSVDIYDQVFSGIFLLSGISRYSWVFLGIPGYFWVYWISSLFLEVVSQI